MSAPWIDRLQDGDEKAWAEFYDKYSNPLLLFFSSRKLFGHLLACDLVQETAVKVLLNIKRFQPEKHETFNFWLFRIAANCRKDALRREGRFIARNERYGRELEDWVQAPSDIDDITDYRDLRDDFRAALEQLPYRRRMVVFLRYCCVLSAKEVAEIMKITVGTVNVQAHEGRVKLEQLLAGEAHARGLKRKLPPRTE